MIWKHCPKCGGKLREEHKKLLVCTDCAFHWYQNPLPTNTAIIVNDAGKIMLAKRNEAPKEGWWDLPGGFVDIGESMEDSLQREIKEELRVDVLDMRFVKSYPGRYLYEGVNFYTLVFGFVVDIGNQNPKPADDVGDIAFFAPKDIPWDTIAFPALARFLRDYMDGQADE